MKTVFIILALLAIANCKPPKLYEPSFTPSIWWDKIDYAFPNNTVKAYYQKTKKYIPESNIPIGISKYKDKLFVTLPKWRDGVVSTLNYIPLSSVNNKTPPRLIPYPDWPYDAKYSPNGNKIISTLHARPDACDRLWLLDLGKEDLLSTMKERGPSSIIVIDLKTDKIILNHTILTPPRKDRTFFADFIVDVEQDNCEDAYMYISDPQDLGITVYSYKTNESWRFNHNFFGPDPLQGDLNVTDVNIHWHDGVLSLALSPKQNDSYKTLYFHAVCSVDEFEVSTKILNNKNNSLVDHYYWFHKTGTRGPRSQALTAHMDVNNKILFFPLINLHAIACWNIDYPLNGQSFKIVAQDPINLAFVSDLIIDAPNNKFYALNSNFPKYIKRVKPYDDSVVWTADLRKLSAPCLKYK